MKSVRIMLVLALLGAGFLWAYRLPATPSHECATCTGAKSCNACKNCKYCKHCAKQGGTCGVCRVPGKGSPPLAEPVTPRERTLRER